MKKTLSTFENIKESAFFDELSKLAGGEDFLAMDPVKPTMPNADPGLSRKSGLRTFNDTQIQPESSDRGYGQSTTPNGADTE